MPSRYVVRDFIEGGVYHISNRGIENRGLFAEKRDYEEFLKYLYIYVRPHHAIEDIYPNTPPRLLTKNLSSEVDILAYCVMPTHFHFLIRQHTNDGISKLMKQLTNAYTSYFNKKINRRGTLFQGRYQAVAVDKDKNLVPLSRYIHLNPVLAGIVNTPENYPWSSFSHFLDGNIETACQKRVLLSFFKSAKHYNEYIQDKEDCLKDVSRIKRLLLEDIESFPIQVGFDL